MLQLVLKTSRVTWVRFSALVFTCVAFSAASYGGLVTGGMADWSIFCWAFSFAGTLLVLVVELMGLQSRATVSWIDFPGAFACYALPFCLYASIIILLYFLKGEARQDEVRDHRIASSVSSCLATVAYFIEVSLTRAQPAEFATQYMVKVPGLVKVCETFVASVIFVFVSDPVSYDSHWALKWCMAVYCICFMISAAIVVMCVAGCTGWMSFDRFLSFYSLLAAVMYLTATIIWPVFNFDSRFSRSSSRPDYCRNSHGLCPWDKLVVVAVLTALNFLIYLTDLVYSVRMLLVRE
ncbi:myeloid-associated differentiation marker homolog [Carassius auratus]|uniref:Myeloid-associated differentiation marker homolog n=1 Tax=Carassius auratus TaxID=7957 RepID=A0A6P6MYY5_CARAU|nr:myeloid-associated differentiation marker homolog [Carassius auratus]